MPPCALSPQEVSALLVVGVGTGGFGGRRGVLDAGASAWDSVLVRPSLWRRCRVVAGTARLEVGVGGLAGRRRVVGDVRPPSPSSA